MNHQEQLSHSESGGFTTTAPSLTSLLPIPPSPSLDMFGIHPLSISQGPLSTAEASPLISQVEDSYRSLVDASPSSQSMELEPRRRSRRAAAMAAREAIISSATRAECSPNMSGKKRKPVLQLDDDSRPMKFAGVEDQPSFEIVQKGLKPPPNAKDDANYETDDERKEEKIADKCCICMGEPEHNELAMINSCEHRFCFDCIAKWGERENTCPLCKFRFTKISRVYKAKRRHGVKAPPNTKHVRERNQRSDLVSGAALEAMLNSIAASNRASLGGSALGIPRVRRVVFSLDAGSGDGRRVHFASRSTTRRTALLLEEGMIESDQDSADEFMSLPANFNELMRQTMNLSRLRDSRSRSRRSAFVPSHPLGGGWMVPPPPAMYGLFQQRSPPPLPQRSYAVNVNDSSAGRVAENPIEIDDSDDDDVVEVIPSVSSSSS